MKKVLCIISTIAILISTLTGCVKCTNTENSTVRVKIINKYHRDAFTTMYYSPMTKTMLPQSYSAIYRITVEYDGVEYDISGSDTYNKYSNKVGEYTNGTLQTKKYDDGTVRYDIIELE